MPEDIVPATLSREEHRRRWLVLTASFFTLLINGGMSYHVGVLNVSITDRYPDAGVEMIAWLMAFYGSLFALGAPVGSFVMSVSNCRTCIILSGLLSFTGLIGSSFVRNPALYFLSLTVTGIGQSLSFIGGTVGVVYYFPTRVALATGVVICGAGAGSFIHPALFQFLLDMYSLDGAFLILSALCLNLCVIGLLVKPTAFAVRKRQEERLKKSSNSLKMYRSILLNMSFVMWLLAVFFYGIGFQGIIVYFPEYLINHKGYSPLQAATLASFIGIGSLVARPLVGFAATETKIGETLMFVGMNFVSFFIYMVAEEVVSYTFIAYIISIAIGAYTSASQTVMFPVTVSVVGHVKGPSGYGIVLGVFGLSCLFAPPLLAYMFQKFGYTTMFKLSGFLFLGAATLTITTLCGREIETEEVNGVFGNQIGDKIDTNYYELEFHALETELELTTNGVKSLLNTHEHI